LAHPAMTVTNTVVVRPLGYFIAHRSTEAAARNIHFIAHRIHLNVGYLHRSKQHADALANVCFGSSPAFEPTAKAILQTTAMLNKPAPHERQVSAGKLKSQAESSGRKGPLRTLPTGPCDDLEVPVRPSPINHNCLTGSRYQSLFFQNLKHSSSHFA